MKNVRLRGAIVDNNSQKVSKSHGLTASMKFVLCICTAAMLFLSAFINSPLLGFGLLIFAAAADSVMLICADRSPVFTGAVIAVNAIPIIVSAVMLQSAASVITLLYPVMAAAAIGITVKRGMGRTVSVAAAAAVMLLLMIALISADIYMQYGQISQNSVRQYANSIFDPITTLLEEYTLTAEDGAVMYLLPENRIGEVVYLYKLMFIGILCAFSITVSYTVTLVTRLIMKATSTDGRLPVSYLIGIRAHFESDSPRLEVVREKSVWRIAPNPVSAWVFIISYILTFLMTSVTDSYTLTAAVYNMQLILSPLFIYCGAREMILKIRRKKSSAVKIFNFLPIFCIILLFIAPSVLTVFLSFIGAGNTLRESRAAKLQKQIENPTRKDD